MRTNIFVCLSVTLSFLSSASGAEHEIEDFEFADTENGINIVKRAAVYVDDEDFLGDEAGSTPYIGYDGNEGSGTTAVTTTTRRLDVALYPRYFRVSINVSNLAYTTNLDNRESPEFKQQSELFGADIESLFWTLRGRKIVTVLQYSAGEGGQVLVTFDLGYDGSEPNEEISQVLQTAVSGGRIGRYTVSSDDYSLRLLDAATTKPQSCRLDELLCAQNQVCIPRVKACDGSFDCADGGDEEFCPELQCPIHVGRSAEFLPRIGTNYASLLINNVFPCDGDITAWNFYRIVAEGIAFVGVWRQRGDNEFVLISKTELPPGTVGPKYFPQKPPIQVKSGDFIGIFYPKTTPSNVIAQATPADEVVAPTELYQTYNVQLYEEDVEEGIPFNINSFPYNTTNSTFALSATMDYTNYVTEFVCESGEFSCGDGFCIEAAQQCDQQIDCEHGEDELNCNGTSVLAPCLEGEFRCTNGSCIKQPLICDEKPDCPDDADERCLGCFEDEFTCTNGECIAQILRCNEENDCLDGSDEANCVLPGTCGSSEFRCADGSCISSSSRCNSRLDCQGGDDEYDCLSKPCATGEFRCEYGQCIPSVQRCDQVVNCPDGTDELDCPCKETEFTCQNRECIPTNLTCNAQPDCSDNSDEDKELCLPLIPTFPPPCPDGFFRCALGICLEFAKRCNRVNDCPDGSDEEGCEGRLCDESEFRCDSGDCIDAKLKCNSVADCEDRSDEMTCVSTCSQFDFTCNTGHCIDLGQRCDNYPDCPDQSDEIGCSCRPGQFKCGDGQCISGLLKCDRTTDCRDGSDERDCPARCRENEFQCNDGTCINRRSKCDRSAQCPDSSDEFNCTCNAAEFRCGNGQCIPKQEFCDKRQNCVDGSDESSCRQVCRSDDQFTCANGRCIDRTRVCDGRDDCRDLSDEQNCPVPPSFQCMPGQFRCTTGQCIDAGFKCDRLIDCLDRSDETRCPPSRRCPDTQFQCDSGHCLDLPRRCDGRRDCPNGSDEVGCPTCSPTDFTCANGQCIRSTQHCDRRHDCLDGSDEIKCPCPTGEFACVSDGRCLPPGYRCNGNPDCRDGSDEQDCKPDSCREGEFQCDSGECINDLMHCDYSTDCPDGSDEDGCDEPCRDTEFTCLNGQCVALSARCNGSFDCWDRSDEQECVAATCSSSQFTCSNGDCITSAQRCNRRRDCSDGSDESNCQQPCRDTEFTCLDGQCVALSARCNGRFDCRDRSDEQECVAATCSSSQFTCSNGDCITSAQRCNRRWDCSDGSDENNCQQPCRDTEFTCLDGQCVALSARCNGRFDCRDRSDEQECVAATCSSSQFTCSNGDCITSAQRCNRRWDCSDGSDENNCQQPCRDTEFTCLDGQCVALSARCNGRFDCRDRSDEQECVAATCSSSQFTCSNGDCITSAQRCNRRWDCSDGSDENNCPCSVGEFTCVSDGFCLPAGYKCNGNRDCGDGSDEQNCACTQQEFRCSNGQCIPRAARCNRQYDCQDGSDERSCDAGVTVTISPQQMRKRVGTSASFVCQVTGGPSHSIVWSRRTGGAMPAKAAVANARLTITNLRLEDSGDYVCQANTSAGTFEAVARLDVEFIGPPTVEPRPDGPCGRDQATCSNSQCIPRDYICDGEPDCTDRSDEENCNVALPCEPNEFRCNNGRCAMKIWRCDGDNDCLDDSDESNCPTRIPGASCESHEFMCQANDQCVPFGYQCDGEVDCQDRSDEIGCTQPSISTPPMPEITVDINGTFTIICEAVGTPTPLIVWRLNWGNIPTGDRVTVTSVGGRGVLTVRNAVVVDAGAYTCEAMNNRGSIFAIPDANIIVRRTVGVCQSPRFNAEAVRPDQCIQCFCFGRTQTCYSSNLQISQITLGNQVTIVKRPTLEPVGQSFIQYVPNSREFEVRDFNRRLGVGDYYWSLPYQYLNKRLNSYGGELAYRVYYEVDRFDVSSSGPDVIISGNGITLHHRSQTNFRPRTPTRVGVPLVESAWERSPDSPREGPISEYATREELMQVLENVTTILIRATYDNRQTLIRIGDVLLTSGVQQITGLGRAASVEECSCPTGYTGSSCEDCAAGFYKVERGRYSRECIACNCNGHSNDCDPFSGICRNCRDNTVGPYCNECAVGYVGDPRGGRACQACPCPLTTSGNQFSPACAVDRDGEIFCTACLEGYTGRRCERCDSGFRGNPLTPGDRCVRVEDTQCDQRGSQSSLPDVVTQQCRCKPNVEGQYCNRCKPNHFYLSPDSPYGCLACFCMGVTQTCQSTTLKRAQISLPFTQSPSDVVLTDMMQQNKVSEGLTIDRQTRELVYRGFSRLDRSIHYWSLPQQFLGDKVTSYGGVLRFTIRYRAGRDRTPVSRNDPVVEIGGNDITLVHRLSNLAPEENRPLSFSVPFIETQWYRVDGEPATREHLLMALADLDFILIRATYTVDTQEAALSAVSLDIAESRETGQERAYPVEQCACPRGYKGLSCEDCDTGYTRSGGGLYLGLCEPCQCNGHSSECDPKTGVCRNCRHHTEGDYCERCSRGFHGLASRGSVYDCQKCPCPLTESPNQFSPECRLDADGQVTCSACPVGHTGRRCERCTPGYQGNPNQPGDYCKLINVTCDCDERGTVRNTLCDPSTQQCQCKNNVQGRRCSACKDGYFNLNTSNEMGCLKCFCLGVTTQCSSSNYYRDEIVPMLNADGTHNFQLTNRLLSRNISDGFTVNAERNEITFRSFEGAEREKESLFFSLPPKFIGDKISSYGGFLRFGLSYTTLFDAGQGYIDVDVEIISKQDKRLYYLHQPSPLPKKSYSYDILLTENSFISLMDRATLSRETFLSVLADIKAILIRATYHNATDTVTLQDLRMEIAVPRATGQRAALEVESCVCPEGYTGLSCQSCAAGYLREEDSATAVRRCVRCRCNGHATSCDPQTGVCQNCQDNTVGDRCERCAPGYYRDPKAGTLSDCRVCPCPLTIPSNQFSSICFLDQDSRVTCEKCPLGYTGRDCGQCTAGYQGNPYEPGGRCERITVVDPRVIVNPVSVTEPLGSTATFQCIPSGRAPFNVVWSRIDGRSLPRRATQGPGPNYPLTITNLEYSDSARYVCQVTNAQGTVRDSGTLTVEQPGPSLRIRIEEPTTVETRPGQTANFTCVAIQYSSAANYVLAWTKDGGVMPSKAIDQNGVLMIPDLTESDLGTYVCTGSQPGEVDRATATITFGDAAKPPSVRIDPSYRQVFEGDRVEFRCNADGSPRPTLTWTKGRDGPLLEYVYTDETGIFRIASVSMSDRGGYYCTATNSVGTSSVRAVIYVERQSGIEVVTSRTDITAVIGQSEQLDCYVKGGNGVTLTWTKEGGLPIGTSQENGLLSLTNIQPSYAGIYTCTASTRGEIVGRATSRITVIGTPYTIPSVRIEPAKLTVGTGTTGSLRCIATGEPQPSITWSRAHGQLSSNHQLNGEFLRILQATMDDRDIYVCTASNVAGNAQATVFVEIERREPPKVKLYPDSHQVLKAGSNARFQCRVLAGIPPPVVTWARASGQEFTSRTEIEPDNGIITFNSITVEEQGDYLCTATNEVGTFTTTASLTVEGPPSVVISPGNRVTSIVGDIVNISCKGLGNPKPSVVWKSEQRRRSDVLPQTTDAGLDTARLLFESIQKGDEGLYSCVAINKEGKAEGFVDVIVNERKINGPAGVFITGPGHQSHVIGQTVELNCSAIGLPDARLLWRRQGNQPMPPGHSVRNGVLSFSLIDPRYAGEYICSATTAVEFSASVYIIANGAPVVSVTPKQSQASIGGTVVMTCQVYGDPPPIIEWEREQGPLPVQHQIENGVLTIFNAQPNDSDRYICRASSTAGTATDYTVLTVAGTVTLPGLMRVAVGDTIDVECLATGNKILQLEWTKLDGHLPESSIIRKNNLTIPNARLEDAGTYICTVTNDVLNVHSTIRIEIFDPPVIQIQQDYIPAALGTPAQLRCDASGEPRPIITWMKEVGHLPYDHSVLNTGELHIPKVREEDAGTYTCEARNQYGTDEHQVVLVIGAFVPYFQQNPVSYMSFAPLRDAYLELDILLSFRPEATDGLVFYNGQFVNEKGDFVCFGLQEKYPQFRFDLGSGVTTIRGAQQLELNKWHTVHLRRTKKNGTMLVNDEPVYRGEASGDFQGLDLAQPMYLGVVPDIASIPPGASFGSGFVGGISEFKVKGVSINLGTEAQEIVSVDPYPVCDGIRCENEGLCRPEYSPNGFACDCPRGFAGHRCELLGRRCYQNACGHTGRCFNWPAVSGFDCICPIGYAGEGCNQSVTFMDPAFNKTSFISYPTISGGLLSVRVQLLFKPQSLDDGIVLYNARQQDGQHDFIAIIIKDQHLEFRFDTGSGPALLRSRNPLTPNDWTIVVADRKGREGTLIVNEDEPVNVQVAPNDRHLFSRLDRGDVVRGTTSGDKTVGLNLERLLYLGGVDPLETINPNAGAHEGFIGCIGELTIGDKTIKLFDDALDSFNVEDCGERKPCDRHPCQNTALCLDISPTEYRCNCSPQFTGTNCETELTICVTRKPCQNGGRCVVVGTHYRCDCPTQWTGKNCESQSPIGIHVNGNGYAEFRKDLLTRTHKETISFTIITTAVNGLFFWQGQLPGKHLKGNDYLALALRNGFVEFGYEMGSGPGLITSVETVNDGYPHVVVVERSGRNGIVTIDNKAPAVGMSGGILQILNVPGNIFFGGVPDPDRYTAGLFRENFVGCLAGVKVHSKLLDFSTDAVSQLNTTSCYGAK